ncbi:hypothetical protein [Kaistella palustris]|uniref:hypothetical protein n=1 Tax=Kaistella palustris TaxID=493376 RepID=UPI00041EC0D2|nr:hypothetical protein [Kaistella palustris]
MKKIILGVALAGLLIGCKKVQAGGNLGVLKMEAGAERYSDDQMKEYKPEANTAPEMAAPSAAGDSTQVSATMTPTVKTDSLKARKPATDTSPAHQL